MARNGPKDWRRYYYARKERQEATNAKNVENMNEAQLRKEIGRLEKSIDKLKQERENITSGESAEERGLRESFPLGTGGFTITEARRRAGGLGERALERGRKLESIINRQESQEKRLESLKSAMGKVRGTGKTLKQIEEEQRNARQTTWKWSTTQKQSYTGSGLAPRIIKSGDYEIRGKSVLRIFYNGQEIGTAMNLKDAKSFAELYDKRRKK